MANTAWPGTAARQSRGRHTTAGIVAAQPWPRALGSTHRGILRVGAEYSGMEPVVMALRNLGMLDHCSLEFCCEIDRWRKSFTLQNPPKKKKYFFDDIKLRDPSAVPPCDLYDAGFLCQPFSITGLRQWTVDSLGRGTILEHILEYLRIHRPRCYLGKRRRTDGSHVRRRLGCDARLAPRYQG